MNWGGGGLPAPETYVSRAAMLSPMFMYLSGSRCCPSTATERLYLICVQRELSHERNGLFPSQGAGAVWGKGFVPSRLRRARVARRVKNEFLAPTSHRCASGAGPTWHLNSLAATLLDTSSGRIPNGSSASEKSEQRALRRVVHPYEREFIHTSEFIHMGESIHMSESASI